MNDGTIDRPSLPAIRDSRSMIFILLVLLVMALATATAPSQELQRYTNAANRLAQSINSADYKSIQATFNAGMDAFMPLSKSTEFFKGLTRQYGKIESLGEPRLTSQGAVFVAKCVHGALDMTVALDDEDRIAGLLFVPHTSSKPAPEKHQTQLSLPFKGRWLVFWGGDTKELNQHHDVPNQRYAFDLLGADENGLTRRGKSGANEDYVAFGREILAPADGIVVEVIEGVHDNAPGSMNPYSAVGNCVVIQHRDDEISVLAHLKLGSILVRAGDKVKRGQVLGRCGNSGNSSEPHLHYHLQNSPVFQDGQGIKSVFQEVIVTRDGQDETRTNYSPVKGDVIRPE